MKYALSILFTVVLAFNVEATPVRKITSFRDSSALTSIAQFMYDATEDIPMSLRLSDKKMNIKDLSKCTVATSDEIISEVESSIKKVLRYYPDEELPFEEALIDLKDYLDHKTFKECHLEKQTSQSYIKSIYYVDSTDRIHLRLDNITLISE